MPGFVKSSRLPDCSVPDFEVAIFGIWPFAGSNMRCVQSI
jgi:hypothetical protein